MNNLYYNNKKLKKIKEKRTQKPKKIWGWILTAIGGVNLISTLGMIGMMDTSALIAPFLFLIPGLYLLLSSQKKVRTWDRYEAIIDNYGNTPISLIAKKMGFSEKKVYSDLQEMIHSDFFIGPNYNIEAYLDAERDLLVMTSGGRPLKPLPDLPEEEPQAYTQAQAQPEPEPEVETPAEEEEELSDLERIREAIATVKDEETRAYLYGLEGSVRRIDERLQAQPELMEKMSIKRLYKYYLPQILELIRKYMAPDTPADLKAQIREALGTSASALANIEADLMERDQMDAEVDIEVLKNMFAQDGLLGRSAAAAPGGAARPAGAKAGQAAAAQAQQKQTGR